MNTNSIAKPYNPPKKYVSGPISTFINWAESMNERYSIHGNPPVYDNSSFPWVKEVENEWLTIRSELEDVMKYRTELPNFHDIMTDIKPISSDNNWKIYFLVGYGIESEENCKRCPETARILKKIPAMKTAFFSILSPNKHIPAHKGPFNGVLRYHLGLIIPEPKEKCRIRVHDQIKLWGEGESIIFNDTYEHEVWNETDGVRVVLFVDFVRPIKFPFSIFNKIMILAAAYIPAIQEAIQNQKKWEKQFYKKK